VSIRERRSDVAAGLVVAAAAVLRLAGISWGLRHSPLPDESAFVASVVEMIRHHDLDQRFYEYPGLFFLLLRLPLSFLDPDALGTSRTYLVSRLVVAVCGTLSVVLVYLLARRLVSPRGGLAGAILLAVAPAEVSTAHMVRPDVVLEAGVLVFFTVLYGVEREWLRDALSGLVLGAATAVKPTGVALLPSLALHRGQRAGRRLRGLAIAGLSAAAVFVLATPYLLVEPGRFRQGFGLQVGYHYSHLSGRVGSSLGFYLEALARSLGPVGCALVVAGVWAAKADRRRLLPLLVFPVTLVSILSTATAYWTRLVVPCIGPLAIVAGAGYEAWARRWPRTAATVLALGALGPLASSLSLDRQFTAVGTRDRVLDWAESHLPEGSSILTVDPTIGFDPSRFQVLVAHGFPSEDRLLAPTVDAVVWSPRLPGMLPGRAPMLSFASTSTKLGGPLDVYVLPEASRIRRFPLDASMLSASSSFRDLPRATDDRLDTFWRSAEDGDGVAWIELRLPRTVNAARLDLLLGERPGRAGRDLEVAVADGEQWRSLRIATYAPRADEKAPCSRWAPAEVLVFAPVATRRMRLSGRALPGHRWGFAELRLYELDGSS
jgi:hypothetical protein